MKRTVHIYSNHDGIRKKIREAFNSNIYEVVEHCDKFNKTRLRLEHEPDLVVSETKLNSRIEGFAANLALKWEKYVYAITLPEGLDYIRQQLDRKGQMVLVGSDQA